MVSIPTEGDPNSAQIDAELPSNAVEASAPAKRGSLPNSSPNREATLRTEKISGRQRFHATGGEFASESARITSSLASPCQMQLK